MSLCRALGLVLPTSVTSISYRCGVLFGMLLTISCAPGQEPTAIHLVDRFPGATVENAVPASEAPPTAEWNFDEDSTGGWRAIHGIEDLAVRDGRLVARTGEASILAAPGPENPDPDDFFHALEIEMRVSSGTRLGLGFDSAMELDVEEIVDWVEESSYEDFNVELQPGKEFRTYTLTTANALFASSFPLSTIRHILIRPTDAAGAEFEIASIRLISLREHLASIPFTGKLSNLHQGVEVLHESTSMPEFDHSGSKTSRTYVDRLLEWIESHDEVPFFALLHVFDPHSPFEPYRPYETLFLEHGNHFHGLHTYGEMLNVPLMLWWPSKMRTRTSWSRGRWSTRAGS